MVTEYSHDINYMVQRIQFQGLPSGKLQLYVLTKKIILTTVSLKKFFS